MLFQSEGQARKKGRDKPCPYTKISVQVRRRRSSRRLRPIAVSFRTWSLIPMQMPTADTNSVAWDSIIGEYQSLVDKYHWPFQPMLELAQEISRSAPASLYPMMSHEHLGFSLVPDYPQCVRLPQVWISYLPQSELFEVMFRESLHGRQKKTFCQPQEARQVVEVAFTELLVRQSEVMTSDQYDLSKSASSRG